MKKGRIFTIEGGDGSGKATQTDLLMKRLVHEDYPVRTLDYPNDTAALGPRIREILREGKISEVDPLLFATLYSYNRYYTKPLLDKWVHQGLNIILDRYTEANFGHQAAKLDSEEERKLMIEKLQRFETEWLGLPKSHRVIYLDLPHRIARDAMQNDDTRKELDMHERAGAEYKERVRQTFLWCAETFPHWIKIDCLDEIGKRIQRYELSDIIFRALRKEFVNKKEKKKKSF